MAWIGQGPLSDRTREHLATSDKGVILFHNLILENVAKVERGEDPMGVIRDPAKNVCIQLDDPENRNVTRRPAIKADGYEPILAQARTLVASAK